MFRLFGRLLATLVVACILAVLLDRFIPAGTQPPWGFVIFTGYLAGSWFVTGAIKAALVAGSRGPEGVPFAQHVAGAGFEHDSKTGDLRIPYPR
jgi:hypothetical protein